MYFCISRNCKFWRYKKFILKWDFFCSLKDRSILYKIISLYNFNKNAGKWNIGTPEFYITKCHFAGADFILQKCCIRLPFYCFSTTFKKKTLFIFWNFKNLIKRNILWGKICPFRKLRIWIVRSVILNYLAKSY